MRKEVWQGNFASPFKGESDAGLSSMKLRSENYCQRLLKGKAGQDRKLAIIILTIGNPYFDSKQWTAGNRIHVYRLLSINRTQIRSELFEEET